MSVGKHAASDDMNIRWFERQTLDRVVAERIQKVNIVLDVSPGLQPQMFFRPRLHICCETHPERVRILQDHFGETSSFVILQASALEALEVMPDGSVDSVFLLNSIEHLHKDDGHRLLGHCERIARRQIVVFSPLGFVPQGHDTGDDEDGRGLHGEDERRGHESGWTPEDFDGSWEILASRAYYTAEEKGEESPDPLLGAFWAIKNIRPTINLPVKLAVLAQFLPPSPGGGVVPLYRMFKDLNPDDYCLLSEQDYEPYSHLRSSLLTGTLNATPRLPARYYQLPSSSKPVLSELEEDRPRQGSPPARSKQHSLETPPAESFLRSRVPEWLKLQAARKLINSSRTARRLVRRRVSELLVCFRRAKNVARIVRREGCGAILASSGDPFDLPAGYLASRLARVPFYAYVFDDYPRQWDHTPYRHFARLVGPTMLKGAAGIIVLNEFLREDYRQRYQVEPTVVRNPLEIPEIEDADAAPSWPANEGEISIVYTGTVYHANYDAFRNLIEAIGQLGRPEVKLHLYTSQTREELEQHNISGPAVVYHEHVASSEVFEVQRKADILFLPLAFDSSIPEVIRTSSPGKMGEYLASRRPILAHAPADSFVSWYFREHECGVVVDRSDPAMLAQAIEGIIEDADLRREMGERARERAESDFSLAVAQVEFVKLLQSGVK
jgi:glycosyltransferase involved in cell wall biosynthesis